MRNRFYALTLLGLTSVALPLLLKAERARGQGDLTGCKSQLKNLACACEMWFCCHKDRYPAHLEQLTPLYIKTIPTCPGDSACYRVAADFSSYTFRCDGDWHTFAGGLPNFPQYGSRVGLVER